MITLKEEFVGGAKWKRAIKLAGAEAIQLWLALKAYAASHLTDGFIPDEELDDLPGAPAEPRRVLQALLDCGALERDGTRGAGLVDVAPHGWQLHNYEDHANSSTEEELRKEKARERKRRWRAEQERLLAEMRAGRSGDSPAGHSETDDGTVPRDDAGLSPIVSPGPRAQAGAPPREYARAPAPAQPSPAQPSLLPPERESAPRSAAHAAPPAKPPPRRWRRVPADWQPKPEHVGLAMQLGADIRAEEAKFRDHEFRDPKSDADACFRTWLKRSIELRRQALTVVGPPRAADQLDRQLARARALSELEATPQPPQPKALP